MSGRWQGVHMATRLGAMALLASVCACGPHYDHHELLDVSLYEGATFSPNTLALNMPVGSVVLARPAAIDSSDEPYETNDVESLDPSVLEILPVAEDPGLYAFVARGVGRTQLVFFAEGERVTEGVATVSAP